jgi:hypothetical protein
MVFDYDTRRACLGWIGTGAGFLLALGACGIAQADPAGANHESAHLQVSELVGYPGGTARKLICPDSAPYMAGVDGRFGNWIDALAPLCVGYNASGRWDRGVALTGDHAGGSGGHPDYVVCPAGSHITKFRVDATRYKPEDSPHVFAVSIQCGDSEQDWLDTPFTNPWVDCSDCLDVRHIGEEIGCPDGTIVRGMQVSASEFVESVALLCGPPPTRAKYLGRVQSNDPDAPAPTLCEAAASARARNSPAAASLEAQCQASKGPPVQLGRAPNMNVIPPDPAKSICDYAKSARARNSPAAASLEKQCLEQGGQLQ